MCLILHFFKKSRQTKRTFGDNFGTFFFFAGYHPTLIQRSITHIHFLFFIFFNSPYSFVCLQLFVRSCILYTRLIFKLQRFIKSVLKFNTKPKPTLQKHCILPFSQQTNEFVISQRFDNNNKLYLKNNVTKYP